MQSEQLSYPDFVKSAKELPQEILETLKEMKLLKVSDKRIAIVMKQAYCVKFPNSNVEDHFYEEWSCGYY